MGTKGGALIYYFINIYAFILDNKVCFFDNANDTRSNTSDFIHRIYNYSKSELEGVIWS